MLWPYTCWRGVHLSSEGAAVGGFAEQMAAARVTLFRFAATLTSVNDAEDLVQEALSRGWLKREQYDSQRGSVQAWLLSILAGQARAGWRRARPLQVHLTGDLPSDAAANETRTTMTVDVLRAVNSLPARQRLAIVLSVYVDLPLTEVAAVMGCSIGTVKATIHSARANLASALGATYALDR